MTPVRSFVRRASSSVSRQVGRGAIVALTATLAAGCSTRVAPVAVVDPWPARLAQADADAAEGCYRCLARAFESYRAAVDARRTAAGPAAYRVAVLLALRERMIGLYPGTYQEAPAALEAVASADDVRVAAPVLPVMPWRRGTLGLTTGVAISREALDQARAHYQVIAPLAEKDAWHATVVLSLIGSHPFLAFDPNRPPAAGTVPGLDTDVWKARFPDDGALSFTRLAMLRGSLDDLATFVALQPSFDETGVLVGDAELSRGRLVSAEEALVGVLEVLPGLVPALALRGDIRQRMEDYGEAIALYDALLARVPEHREAQLGRVKSLGFVGRHREAIVAADAMIAQGTWYLGEAWYWKAWNLFTLGELDPARAAVDASRSLLVNADVHYLGGVIAFRQARLDEALIDFDAAIELEVRHCEAHFDRAALRLTRKQWSESLAGFDAAADCLAARTPTLEQRIVDAREARMPEAARAALVESRERALVAHRHQIAWAHYNGAVGLANTGRTPDARARAVLAQAGGGPAAEAATRLLPQLPP